MLYQNSFPLVIIILLLIFQACEAPQDSGISNSSYELRQLNEAGEKALETGNLDTARVLIREALEFAQNEEDPEAMSHALANKGNLYLNLVHPDSVHQLLEPYIGEFEQTEYGAYIPNLIATAHYRQGRIDKSLEYFHEALRIAEESEDERFLAGIHQNIGNVYRSYQDYSSAADQYLKGLEMAKAIQDSAIQATVLKNIGYTNNEMGEYERAKRHLYEAVDLDRKINRPNSLRSNYLNLGISYKHLQDHKKALDYFERSLELAEDIGNPRNRIQVLFNMARTYMNQSRYDLAEETFRQALRLSEENRDIMGMHYSTFGLGEYYLEINKPEEAVGYLNQSHELAGQIQNPALITKVLELLSESYNQLGEHESAYRLLREYTSIQDSIFQEDNREALARQETVLELQNEQENRQLLEAKLAAQQRTSVIGFSSLAIIATGLIALLLLYRSQRQTNKALNLTSEQLNASNKVKAKLLTILAHDLRSPLTSLQGVMYMIKNGVIRNNMNENMISDVELKLNESINTLSSYLEWSKNQQDGFTVQADHLNVADLIEPVLDEFRPNADYKNITLTHHLPSDLNVHSDTDMLRVILRNLISNAIKYSDAGGSIFLTGTEKDATVEISVHDCGPGLSKAKQQQLFDGFADSSRNYGKASGTGFGLSICRELTEKLNGNLSVDSTPGEGSVFTIELPKATEHQKNEEVETIAAFS